MNCYLLNVTFYAGSNAEEDTDKGLFILRTENSISKLEMKDIFKEVNRLCDAYSDDEDVLAFPVTYEDGLNINTLMQGVEEFTKGQVRVVIDMFGHLEVNDVYMIEQWQ